MMRTLSAALTLAELGRRRVLSLWSSVVSVSS